MQSTVVKCRGMRGVALWRLGKRGSPSGRHVHFKRVRRGSVPHISFCKGFLHVLFVCAYYTAKKAACSETFQTFCFALNTISLFIVCSTTRCSVRRMGKGPLKTSRKRREKGVFISKEDVCSSPLFPLLPHLLNLSIYRRQGERRGGRGPFSRRPLLSSSLSFFSRMPSRDFSLHFLLKRKGGK